MKWTVLNTMKSADGFWRTVLPFAITSEMAKTPRRQKMPVQLATGVHQRDCVLVGIDEAQEPTAKYELEDGTQITMRHIIQEIWRVENEYDHAGNPVYIIKATPVINTIPADNLKRKVN